MTLPGLRFTVFRVWGLGRVSGPATGLLPALRRCGLTCGARQVTTLALELVFFDAGSGRTLQRGAEYRDARFPAFSARFGWAVTGVAPVDQVQSVAVLARARERAVCAAGHTDGALTLHRFPCASPNASARSYRAHKCPVAALAFTPGDARLLTLGARDGAVLQVHPPLAGGTRGHGCSSDRVSDAPP